MKEEAILRSVLSDILKGLSYFEHGSKKVYVKHLKTEDTVDYEDIYDKYYKTLERKGVESEEQLLDRFRKNGLWSEEEEKKLESLKNDVESCQATLDKIFIERDRKEFEKHFREVQKDYNFLYIKKWDFIKNSREVLTNKKINDYYVISSLYKDARLTEKFVSEEENEDIDYDYRPLIKGYDKISQKMSSLNIKKICIKPFFRDSWDLCDSNAAYYYFGKPLYQLTYNQTALANYAIIFGNIFKNYPEIKADDPDKILQLAKQRNEAEKRKANSKSKGSPTYLGMSSDEYSAMGMQRPAKESLFEKAAKSGGKLRLS